MNEVGINELVEQGQDTKTAQKVSIRARLARLKQSPWVLLTAPLIGGCVWLANNRQVITDNINQPYALLFWPMFFACIVAVYLLFVFFKAIVAGLKALGKAILAWLRRPGAAFWIGTGIFMIVSIAEGSGVFNEIFQDNFNGMLGFAAAISIDAISVTCILARQDASRRNNTFGKHFFMAGIIACALISTMANGYITKEHYSAPTNIAGTIWVYCAYAIGLIPPIYIVFLGFASDYISDQKSDIFLDPVAYEKSQKDRLKFLQVQLDAERETKRIKDELALLRGKKAKEIRVPAWSFLGFTVYQKQSVLRQQELTVLPGASLQPPVQNLSTLPSTENADVVDEAVDVSRQPVDDLFVDNLLDGGDDDLVDDEDDIYVSTKDAHRVDTGERETVNWQMTSQATKPRPRITVKLQDLHGTPVKKERITDNLASTTKKTPTRKVNAVNAKERIRRLLKKQPDMEPAEIAAKVGVTRQHAHKVKAQIIAEMQA